MNVTVKVYAALRRYLPESAPGPGRVLQVADGATVAQVMGQLQIPVDTALVPMVNGTVQKLDHVLREGDTLHLFPPVVGG